MERIKLFFVGQFKQPNYLYFLISMIAMLILPAFAPFVIFGDLLLKITYGIVLLMACIYTSKNYKDLIILGSLAIVAFFLFFIFQDLGVISLLNPIITLVFFGMVFIRLMQHVFTSKAVSINDILALCSGYLILGLIAAPFFFVLDMQLDNSLSLPKGANFYDLLYFSYITLTGVGYGDIVPVHLIAKSIALVLGIVGQLYLAILAGIIIGKYLTTKEDV